MNQLYFILSVAGWAWLAVVAVFLVIRLTIALKAETKKGLSTNLTNGHE